MSFLLDTDICSAYLKNERRVVSKMLLHFGNLSVSAITAGELFTWTLRAKAKPGRLDGVRDLLKATNILPVDQAVAEQFGALRAALLDRGRVVGEFDLINAATALVHNLTMVTHNTRDYADVPGIRLADWLAP